MITLFEPPRSRGGIVPRDYQKEAHDTSIRLWNDGVIGALIRAATGTGKTLMASLVIDTWLRRGDDYRAMVVSYETQLVNQFADEIEDYLGIRPGIEMASERASCSHRIVVASRASLLYAPPPPPMVEELRNFGIRDLGAAPKRLAETLIKQLRKGVDPEVVRDYLADTLSAEEANERGWSRVHRFDWRLNWLLVFDEAHRHSHHLLSVGPLVDWFEQNPLHRRVGLTATPKRADGVSIGERMFPGIALDYPLVGAGRCAVRDGYAVPYVQKYIEVEGVDFKSPEFLDPKSESGFDDNAVAAELEKHLAGLVQPTLALAGRRRTLIFCGTVDIAKKVAAFINARRRFVCECGKEAWHDRDKPEACECGLMPAMESDNDEAREIDGESPPDERKEVYRAHQAGAFQYLVVCGLCREGYNDPDISCVAVFRPVSKKASSLAEQMKGRGCRPLRSLARRFHEMPDAEARRQAIAESEKPDCLIIDLVGITGLADCASTVQIYAEGKPAEIIKRAEELSIKGVDIEEAIEQSEKEEREAKERVRLEREEAERQAKEEAQKRAKARANAQYSVHDFGFGSTDPKDATDGQWKFLKRLGLCIEGWIPTKKQAGRMIDMLLRRIPVEQVAHENRIPEDCWHFEQASEKQRWLMAKKGIPFNGKTTGHDASLLIDAALNPNEFENKTGERIAIALRSRDLDGIGYDLKVVQSVLPRDVFERLADAGRTRRTQLEPEAKEIITSQDQAILDLLDSME